MAQAIVNPEELRRFAGQLKRFNEEVSNNLASLHGRLVELGSTWRDQEHEKFLAEFEVTMKAIGKFVEASNQHIPFLMRKAARAEDYLSQR